MSPSPPVLVQGRTGAGPCPRKAKGRGCPGGNWAARWPGHPWAPLGPHPAITGPGRSSPVSLRVSWPPRLVLAAIGITQCENFVRCSRAPHRGGCREGDFRSGCAPGETRGCACMGRGMPAGQALVCSAAGGAGAGAERHKPKEPPWPTARGYPALPAARDGVARVRPSQHGD